MGAMVVELVMVGLVLVMAAMVVGLGRQADSFRKRAQSRDRHPLGHASNSTAPDLAE